MLTDQFGMSFYALSDHKFTGALDTHTSVNRKNPISGHEWTENVPKKNIEAIEKKNEEKYQKWLKSLESKNWYSHGMPRTPRETRMIQAQIDGESDWWNVR